MASGRSLKIGYSLFCVLLLTTHGLTQFTREFIGRNTCSERTNGTIVDNLSCISGDNMDTCFSLSDLCTGQLVCSDGTNNGDGNIAITCNDTQNNGGRHSFFCNNRILNLTDVICNGVDDCGDGEDELNSICDNKCLLEYYGGCMAEQRCQSSRNSQNCGECVDGFELVVIGGATSCQILLNIAFEDTLVTGAEGGMAELCLLLSYDVPADFSLDVDPEVVLVFTDGSAMSGTDFIIPTPATVTLSSAAPRQCLNVSLQPDIFVDGQEFFTVDITVPGLVPGRLSIGPSAQVLITDGNSAAFGFDVATFNAVEEDQQVQVIVELANNVILTEATDLFVVVMEIAGSSDNFAIVSGNNADLMNLPAGFTFMVTFPANSGMGTQQMVTIGIVNDMLIEDAESFSVILRNSSTSPFVMLDTATVVIQRNDDPTYEFRDQPFSFVEQDNTVSSIMLAISNGVFFLTGGSVSRIVSVSSVDGTAIGGLDFTAISNMQVTYSALNSLSQVVPLTIMDDEIIESSEQLMLEARDSISNALVASAPVTLLDDDLVEFSFVTLNQMVPENVGSVMICVRLDAGILTTPVTVTLDFAMGTASATDFANVDGTLEFTSANVPGTDSAIRCLTRAIVDDSLVERSESFTVTGTGANFTDGSVSTITIEDNDEAIFEILPAVVEVDEGPGAEARVSVRLAATSDSLTFPISIDLETRDGSAEAGLDFTSTTDTLIFPATSVPLTPSLAFTVPLIVNTDVEDQEMFEILASIPADGTFTSTLTTQTIPVTINDGDGLTIGFEEPSYSVTEGGTIMICLVVSDGMLAEGVSLIAQLSLAPAGGSPATPDVDYNSTLVPEYVVFMRGNPSECVAFSSLQDDSSEGAETLSISAVSSNGSRLAISPDTAAIEITDDDLLLFQFTMPAYTSMEGGSAVMICLVLADGSIGNGQVTIDVASSGGTAISGTDYTAISAVLTFPEGSPPTTERCFEFLPTNDTIVEDTETVLLTATSDRATFTVGGDMATIFIEDDDELVVRLIPNGDITVPEDVGWVQVCAAAVQNPQQLLDRSVTFALFFKDGTAISVDPKDYQAKRMEYTITPQTLNNMFCKNITIIDDSLCEFSEYFSSCLEAVSSGVTFKYSELNITITDNDVATITGRNSYSVGESQDELSIYLSLVGEKAPGRSCVVTWSTMDGTAIGTGSNNDYVAQTGESLTFTSSVTSQMADITLVDDRRCEGDETFQVFLSVVGDECQLAEGLSPINVTIVDDELNAGGGDDPHFSIVLTSGKIMCFTVQGEHGFSFNLISNNQLTMNAKFVPDARRSEVTWMGTMGIIVHHNSYKGSNMTKLRFEVSSKTVHIGDKMTLQARNIEKLTFKNGKLTITEATPVAGYKVPSIYVDLEDVEVTFTMKFMKEHLDIYWHRTGMKITDSHGLIGQFFRKGVEIDEVRKILIMPNKEPVPVMRRPIWSFMERKVADDEMCWTAMNPGYQGEGLIDGTYFDYLVDDVMSTDFKFSAKKN